MVSKHLKNISQIKSFLQVGLNIKNLWNHHLAGQEQWQTLPICTCRLTKEFQRDLGHDVAGDFLKQTLLSLEPSKQPKFNYKSTPTSCDMTLFGIFLVVIFDSFSYLFLSFLRFSLALFLFLFHGQIWRCACLCWTDFAAGHVSLL